MRFISEPWESLLGFGLTAFLMVACSVTDGAFEQVSGQAIDATTVHKLKEKGATVQEVETALGTPTERRMVGSQLILAYRSVRARVSTEKLAGVAVSSSTQEWAVEWRLAFVGDRLSEALPVVKVSEKP
jgi:hypothetical protein